jgi:predicted DNA-binding transcriptional regulator AlpA
MNAASLPRQTRSCDDDWRDEAPTRGGGCVDTLLINDVEASRLLGISRSKFHLLVGSGAFRRVKIGRCARYRRADILAFTEQLFADASEDALPARLHTE